MRPLSFLPNFGTALFALVHSVSYYRECDLIMKMFSRLALLKFYCHCHHHCYCNAIIIIIVIILNPHCKKRFACGHCSFAHFFCFKNFLQRLNFLSNFCLLAFANAGLSLAQPMQKYNLKIQALIVLIFNIFEPFMRSSRVTHREIKTLPEAQRTQGIESIT